MTLKQLNHPTPVLVNNTKSKYLSDYMPTAKVTLRENAVGIAEIGLDNEGSTYPDDVEANDLITLSVGETTGSATPIFKGHIRFPIATISQRQNRVLLSCTHTGYGLCEMLVADEYGAQSIHPTLDTLKEILTDSTYGIIPAYVSKILGGSSSGWSLGDSYLSSHVANPTDVIRYREFPYKPADKAINELIDLVTALKNGDAGPHWIVDNSGCFRLKMLGTSQTAASGSGAPDWTLWYSGETNDNGQATIMLGDDADLIDYEEMKAEGNYIVNYGVYRNPGNGDAWTESYSGWGSSAYITLSTETSLYVYGAASVKALRNHPTGTPLRWYYPSGKNGGWDFTKLGNQTYIPTLSFSAYRSGLTSLTVYLYTDDNHASKVFLYNSLSGPSMDAETWVRFTIPVGPYCNYAANNSWKWVTEAASPVTWSSVNWIEFGLTGLQNEYALIDGLQFGNVPLCRVAWDSSLPSGATRMRFINDMTPCDDSLVASDDSGTMAQLVKAELLRQRKTTYCPTVKVPILPDALPGMQFSLNGATYRATQIVHEINGDDMTTTLSLNSDLTNGLARRRYEDLLKQYENFKPSTQDRQSTTISRANVDYRVPRLIKDYAP